MKLVIQIPCLNEATVLPLTIAELPRKIEGVDDIEILIIDDGSTDKTSEVAESLGVDRITRFPHRRGLARAFENGLQESLAMGADIIVNTDGDNQYKGKEIIRLIEPILKHQADMTIGVRNIENIQDFSALKKRLQRLGSWAVRRLSNTLVPDATSGFRAYSREAALRLTVVTDFTYTLETIIQATKKSIAIAFIPIETNEKTRESRLFRGMGQYIFRSLGTMLRVYILYQPLKVFLGLSSIFFIIGMILLLRFFYFFITIEEATGHTQSVVVGGAALIIGFILATIGLLSDLIATNRRLIDEILTSVRILRFGSTDPSDREIK